MADHPVCWCRHPRSAHEHYRPGSDCALCGCRRFRRSLTDLLPRRHRHRHRPRPGEQLRVLRDAILILVDTARLLAAVANAPRSCPHCAPGRR